MGDVLHSDGVTCIGNASCTFSDEGSFQCICLPGFEDTSGMDGMNCTGMEEALMQSIYIVGSNDVVHQMVYCT